MSKYIVTGYYPKQYKTKANDTFDMIAYSLYGDEAVASYLIEANPQYADVIKFDPDILLRLPRLDEAQKSTLPQWKGGTV